MNKIRILDYLKELEEHTKEVENILNIEIIRGTDGAILDELDGMIADCRHKKSTMESLIYN